MRRDYSEYQPNEYEKYNYRRSNNRDVRYDYFYNTASFDADSKSIRICVDAFKEDVFMQDDVDEDVAFQERRLGKKLNREDEVEDEENLRERFEQNAADFQWFHSRYHIDRKRLDTYLNFWYLNHDEEKEFPLNNVLSGADVTLQYGEGLLDFIYADFTPAYKEAMQGILTLKAFAGMIQKARGGEDDVPIKITPRPDKVYNRTQEIVDDYFKYLSTFDHTRRMAYCSLYSAICPPLFESDPRADKALRRYYDYLTMLQKEYLELLEFCFDETYYPDVLGELHPAERYYLYRELHEQPCNSRRSETFTFSKHSMSGDHMPYGMRIHELNLRLSKHREVTEQHIAFAEKYGVDPKELPVEVAVPRFLHVEYEFHSVADILDLEFTKLLEHQVRFRKCGRCGKYFIMKGNYDTRYCDRIVEGTSRTCQDVAARENYRKKNEGNQAVHLYNKYYKRYSARVGVKQIREEDFKRWKYLAITKRDECVDGRITVEEYIDWLEASFPNRPRKQK